MHNNINSGNNHATTRTTTNDDAMHNTQRRPTHAPQSRGETPDEGRHAPPRPSRIMRDAPTSSGNDDDDDGTTDGATTTNKATATTPRHRTKTTRHRAATCEIHHMDTKHATKARRRLGAGGAQEIALPANSTPTTR